MTSKGPFQPKPFHDSIISTMHKDLTISLAGNMVHQATKTYLLIVFLLLPGVLLPGNAEPSQPSDLQATG